ncbi:MAG: hypothetical protein AB7I96_13475 [Candidatus Dadabacteria bacterium]
MTIFLDAKRLTSNYTARLVHYDGLLKSGAIDSDQLKRLRAALSANVKKGLDTLIESINAGEFDGGAEDTEEGEEVEV